MIRPATFYNTRFGRYFRDRKYHKFFKSLVPGEVAIDCGANVGKFTQKMCRLGVMVYAFEPDPSAFNFLSEKFKHNKNVILINKAVSDHSGNGKLYFDKRSGQDHLKWSIRSTLLVEKPNADPEAFSEVEIVDLTEFIKSLARPIGMLKMDIEGVEVVVLNKLIDLGLTSKIRHIMIETHERFPTLKDSTKALRERVKALNLTNIDLDWD